MSTTKRQAGLRLDAETCAAVETVRGEGESFAAACERLLRAGLAGGAPDPDPRVVEVHARSKCGRFDMRVGVYTMSRALGMKRRHEAQGWTVTLTPVAEQPKVGADLPDPAAQAAALNADAERLNLLTLVKP